MTDLAPPDATYVRQRWIPAHRCDYANDAAGILREYGSVNGTRIYEKRHQARWQARGLMRLLVELRIYEGHELREHTERRHGGFVWAVEYTGGETP